MLGSNGIDKRRQVDACRILSLLVHVVKNLRVPAVKNFFGGQARLYLRKGCPVAVIVMAGVMMPDHDGLRSLIGSAKVLLVPVDDELFPIGVLRRHEDEDDVVQDGLYAGCVFRRKLIRKLRNALRTGNLSGVNVRRHSDDGLALCDKRLGLFRRGDARISKPALDVEIVIQVG